MYRSKLNLMDFVVCVDENHIFGLNKIFQIVEFLPNEKLLLSNRQIVNISDYVLYDLDGLDTIKLSNTIILNGFAPESNFKIVKHFTAGDLVICKGIGYPHWKNHIFNVNVVFEQNGDLGLGNQIRVSSSDFILFDKFSIVFELSILFNSKNLLRKIHTQISQKSFYFDQSIADAFFVGENVQLRNKFDLGFNDKTIHYQYYNENSIILLTENEIIIVNNKFKSEDWGDPNGNNPHVFLDISNLKGIDYDKQSEDYFYDMRLEFEQFVISFTLFTNKECRTFYNYVKGIIN